MEEPQFEKALAQAREWQSNGMGVPFVISELLRVGYDEEIVDEVMPFIEKQRTSGRKKLARFNFLCGLGLLSLGIALTLVSIAHSVESGDDSIAVWVGLIIAGSLQLFGGIIQFLTAKSSG